MLYLSKAVPVFQGSGLGAAPEATQDRLHAIQEKIEERQRILALPQRFAGSKQLSRREMEIENALFQGTDRHSFLRALYHQGSWAQGCSCLCSIAELGCVGVQHISVSPYVPVLALCGRSDFPLLHEQTESGLSEGFNIEAC